MEQAGQTIFVLITLFDRIVLTGALYRAWGASEFEEWSACIAFAGLVSLFEFGFSLYFNNKITAESERHDMPALGRVYFIANTLFALVSLVGFVVISILAIGAPSLAGKAISPEGAFVVVCLAAAMALRLATCGASSLYRANGQYFRLTIINAISELVRIVGIILVLASGGAIMAAAVFSLVVAATVQCGFILYDTCRRFQPHGFGFALPNWYEAKEAVLISSGYFAQNVPSVMLMYLPVLVLANKIETAGLLAIFVLMRTLTSLPRAILQALGIVAGQECGRRTFGGDRAGALQVLRHSGRAFSALSGIATGLLLGAGAEISALWTGATDTVRFSYLLVGAIPMAIAPISVLAHNVAASTNEPYFAACGRWMQFVFTVLFYWLAPVNDPGLRMLAALSVGEVLGFSPLVYYGMAKTIPGAGVRFHAEAVAVTLIAALITAVMTTAIVVLVQPQAMVGRIMVLMLAGVGGVAILPWLALDRAGRSILIGLLDNLTLAELLAFWKKRRS